MKRNELETAYENAVQILANGKAIYKQYINDGTWDAATPEQQSEWMAILKKREIKVEMAQDELDSFDVTKKSFYDLRESNRDTMEAGFTADRDVFSSEWQDKEDYANATGDWALENYTVDWNV